MFSRVLVTPPTQEPLTADEMRRQVREDSLNKEPTPDAPTVALLAAPAAGNVDNGAHRYRLTFVTADGETDGGTISAPVTVVDKTVNGQVTVSAIPIGGALVTSRKLYRTTAGGSSYFLAATIADNTTVTVTDNVADASLGVAAPTINTTSDPELLSFQKSVRESLESQCGIAFLTQSWRATLDDFPRDYSYAQQYAPYGYPATTFPITDPYSWQIWWTFDQIPLPQPVLQSVTSITYIDPSGAQQTLSTSVYDVDVDSNPGRVILKFGQAWPACRTQRNAVTINYVAGYANPSLVPWRWKQALKIRIAYEWMHRGDEGDPEALETLEKRINTLMGAETWKVA